MVLARKAVKHIFFMVEKRELARGLGHRGGGLVVLLGLVEKRLLAPPGARACDWGTHAALHAVVVAWALALTVVVGALLVGDLDSREGHL